MMIDVIGAIRQWAADKRLPDAALARWLGLDDESRRALLTMAKELRLRTAQMATVLDLIEEIGLRESATAAAILAREPVTAVIAGGGSTPDRASAMIEALRAIRFPELTRAREHLEARIRALSLPRSVRVRLPRELSSDELTLELRAHTAVEMEAALNALGRVSGDLQEIVRLLGKGDEI
ncbi:MAG: hypothetical protein IVW54_12515 [Candidatus Binataceae bacterium]|nr:hypothetical protein [Candidatus Binataceae bacterium]